jgi:hypothetical protein
MILTVLNLDFKDLMSIVIVPSVLAVIGGLKIMQERKEKREAAEKLDLEKHKTALEHDIDKEQLRVNAEIEKEKIRMSGEVEKVKEKSLGAEAVVKIWKNMDTMKGDMEQLDKKLAEEHVNYVLVKEILSNIKNDYDKITKSLWEKFLDPK